MMKTYIEDFYDPPRRRYEHNDEILCAVPSCNCKTDPMPKSYKDLANLRAGTQLYKAYCPAHTHVFDYTAKGSKKWSSNKKRDGLWCRMPIFLELMGYDSSILNCNHSQEYLKEELSRLQEAIDYGSRVDAELRASAFNARFTNEHVFGSKDYGEEYTVCVCSNCANTKTILFGDNKSHQEKAKTTFYTKLKNNLTDSFLLDSMLIESWKMSDAIKGDIS